jgi:hypothetical protein
MASKYASPVSDDPRGVGGDKWRVRPASWWEEVMCNERCTEPTLDELLGDPAMKLLMRSDDVTERDLRALLSRLKDARAARLRSAAH